MKYIYITSARRNPDKNPKEDRNAKLRQYADLDKNNKIPLYYASFTSLPKVGINPINKWKTPIGIYAYPVKWLIRKIKEGQLVDFATDRPFIQILKRTTNQVLSVNYSASKYEKDKKKLYKFFKNKDYKIRVPHIVTSLEYYYEKKSSNGVSINVDDMSFDDVFSGLEHLSILNIKRLEDERASSQVIRLWSLTRTLALAYAVEDETILWNKLLRICGYEMAVDKGLGFIHPNEPCQAVFFTKNALEHVDTIDNKVHRISSTDNQDSEKRFLYKFRFLDEEDYYKWSKINPLLKRIKGKEIQVYYDTDYKKVGLFGYQLFPVNFQIKDFIISLFSKNNNFVNCIFKEDEDGNRPLLQDCTLEKCKILSCRIINSAFIDCAIVEGDFGYDTFDRCDILNGNYGSSYLNVSCTIKNSTIRGGNFECVSFADCTFTNKKACKFINCKGQ